MPKFLRRTWKRYGKLGKNRKKKQTWKKPKGRHNKMREKRKGYPSVVKVGYKKKKDKKIKIIKNIKELEKLKKDEILILGKIGKKKRLEIAKKAKEEKIRFQNFNIDRFLKENIKEKKESEEKKPAKETVKKNKENKK